MCLPKKVPLKLKNKYKLIYISIKLENIYMSRLYFISNNLFSVFTYSQYFIIQDNHSGSKLFFSIVDAMPHISAPIKISNTSRNIHCINAILLHFQQFVIR